MNHRVRVFDPLDERKTFYDPHPGFMGAAIPIPDAVKKVADKLNGKNMSLRRAIDRLKKVTNGELFMRMDCILLKERGAGNYAGGWHIWRVIKYR